MSSLGSRSWRVRRWFDSQRILVHTETQRAVLVIVAVTVAVLLSGILSGVSSLESVWAEQGHYAELCDNSTVADDPEIMILPDAKCQKQALKLLLLSDIASAITYAVIPLTGILTDWQGARRVFGGVVLLLALGNVIATIPHYWTQFIGTTIMSAMGPCLAFNLLVWAQLTPGWTHWIVAIVTASFPGGSFILGSLRVAFLQNHLGISSFFAIWLFVSIPAIYLFVIWPRGIGKPYAASHPLLMIAYFDIAKKVMHKLHIPVPGEVDTETVVELEHVYSTSIDGSIKRLDAPHSDEDNLALDVEAPAPKYPPHALAAAAEPAVPLESESSDPASPSVEAPEVGLDSVDLQLEPPTPSGIKGYKWLDQLKTLSIALLQIYFLLISVWLSIVASYGSYRLVYWAERTGSTPLQVEQYIYNAKVFLPKIDLINVLSIAVAPVAAIIMKSLGAAGTAIIIHFVATISAVICMVPSFQAQILNYYLFPIIRGLIYPFVMMFLIQTCGRRHLGFIWSITVSGASITDLLRILLVKFWLTHDNAWDVLNGLQIAIIGIAWIWPLYVWLKRDQWEETHPEPLS